MALRAGCCQRPWVGVYTSRMPAPRPQDDLRLHVSLPLRRIISDPVGVVVHKGGSLGYSRLDLMEKMWGTGCRGGQ